MSDPRAAILLVDDEEKILRTLARALREEGHEVATAASAAEAEMLLSRRAFDLLIIDNRMPARTGLELIASLVAGTAEAERPPIVLMTAHATVENAVAALKLGAFDYLQKPFEVEELLVVVARALAHQRLQGQHGYLLSEQAEEFNHYGIVGRSSAIQDVMRTIGKVARSKSTVLITGETGTGKELVARAIHAGSAERDMPLIRVNCAAIPESLLESELFGHLKGAFTGATANKKGKFALADGGSILLDEIAALPLPLQGKLLRVLQEREIEPLGSERSHTVDVRVIAATNRDLRTLVQEGRFQEDLYYRLSVIPLEVPPLRARAEDVPLLVDHFVLKHAQRTGKPVERVDDAALGALTAYDWPGNVRELENTVERAVVLAGTPVIGLSDIMMRSARTSPSSSLPSLKLHQNVEWVERESVRQALLRSRGVKKDAAQLLGISQRALSYYLAKYPLDRLPEP